MSWQDQGRQGHGWFGHGIAQGDGRKAGADPAVVSKSPAERASALAYGVIAALPSSLRRRVEAQYQHGTLARLKEVIAAWLQAAQLDQTSFAARFFGRDSGDPVVRAIRAATLRASKATGQGDLRDAADHIADAIKIVGVDRWPRFVVDALDRVNNPVAQSAFVKSRPVPDPAHDAIRPVYPLETAIGIATAAAGGAWAIVRAVGGAVLRESLPESGSSASSGTSLKPSSEPVSNKGIEATSAQRPVRVQAGQQGKHVEGSRNYDRARSTLTADPKDLLNRFAGRGQRRGHISVGQPGSKEVFDTGDEVIGIHRSRSGISSPTTRGMIHYSKRGAHVVPAAPNK